MCTYRDDIEEAKDDDQYSSADNYPPKGKAKLFLTH